MALTPTQRDELCGIAADAPPAFDFGPGPVTSRDLRRRAVALLARDLVDRLGGIGGPYDLRIDGVPTHPAFRHWIHGSPGGPDVSHFYRGPRGPRSSIPSRPQGTIPATPESVSSFISEAAAAMGASLFAAARDERVARFRLVPGSDSAAAPGASFPFIDDWPEALPADYSVSGTDISVPATDTYHLVLTLSGTVGATYQIRAGATALGTFIAVDDGSEVGRFPRIGSGGIVTEARVDGAAIDVADVVTVRNAGGASAELHNPPDMYLRIWRDS